MLCLPCQRRCWSKCMFRLEMTPQKDTVKSSCKLLIGHPHCQVLGQAAPLAEVPEETDEDLVALFG